MGAHVTPENVTLTAEDGFEFYNQLFLPPDLKPGEIRPALIFIHGGSRRQMFLGYHDRIFYHWALRHQSVFRQQGVCGPFCELPEWNRLREGIQERAREEVSWEYVNTGTSLLLGGTSRPVTDVDPERVGLWGLSLRRHSHGPGAGQELRRLRRRSRHRRSPPIREYSGPV